MTFAVNAWLSLSGFLVAASICASAAGNGRFPATGQLVVHPTDPNLLFVRATYGMLVSSDAGANWDWICEEGVGYSGTLDPPIAVASDSTFIVAIFQGLSVAPKPWCGFSLQPGGDAEHYMVDVSIDRTVNNRVLALSSDGLGEAGFSNVLWESADGGRTLTQLAALNGADLLTLTLDAAPTNAQRLYVSSLRKVAAGQFDGLLLRSDDGGHTMQRLVVPHTALAKAPFIGAVHPDNQDVVYVRLDGEGSPLLLTSNAGDTFTTIFEEPGLKLRGFALSPDGSKVAVGGDGPKGGVWVASTSDHVFSKRATLAVQCLTWTSKGLYACGTESVDKFSVGLSTDDGATFTPVLQQGCLRGVLSCSESTTVGESCTDRWEAAAPVLVGNGCGEGGRSAQSDGGGGSSSAPIAPAPSGGCNCSFATRPSPHPTWLIALALAWQRRRMRGLVA